ncbi:MAG TPA: 4-alpha-glucanotransferase [Candidatus Binatia bacterium]|nr:4-alpha-glucanotransferase [Candidatus Binatia bacterium]
MGGPTQPVKSSLRVPLFPPDDRASGVLLHITSLPSPYGIGDLGPAAHAWVDRLQEAGQGWWQALPLGPTGFGNSPYQSFSSFAGNGLLVSPELLIADELLDPQTCKSRSFPSDFVDFGAVIQFKEALLSQAWNRFRGGVRSGLATAYDSFCREQEHWLEDYALFRALKQKFHGAAYLNWPVKFVRREPQALAQARGELANPIGQVRFAQFLMFQQSRQLKEYAHGRGIRLIGDLPFYVSSDSSDVWAHPELFLLDPHGRPRFVAGVPPDLFSADGQLWGNPIYDWEALRRSGFRFYIDRARALLEHVDVIRLDHFRGFAAAWQVGAHARTAKKGSWVPGPGAEFFRAVQAELGHLPFIAEDLGMITPDVSALRDEFHIPGTKVLQFAFDGVPDNPHLPANYPSNSVVYTGTHDNNTARGWFEALSQSERDRVCAGLGIQAITPGLIAWKLISAAWESRAALAMAPLQDLLSLGAKARMNLPGSSDGNWGWRATEAMLHRPVFRQLRDLTAAVGRLRATHRSLASTATGMGK